MAWAVFNVAKEVWAEKGTVESEKERYEKDLLFPLGEPNTAFAQYFKGQSYLAQVSGEQLPIYNVTFEPACRNNWHIHHAKSEGGQILICVAGRGWYQEEGKKAVELTAGKIINIAPEIKHWHGAAKDSWMSHLALEIKGLDTYNEWCEPVSDEEYFKLV